MSTPQANSILVDANVLASQTLHSWIGLIATETRGLWHFYYTEDILAEALHARRRRYPLSSSQQIEDIRSRTIKSGIKPIKNFNIDQGVTYRDKNDAHVHSAAVHARVGILLTNNTKDFVGLYKNPDDCPYELYTTDEFLILAKESITAEIDSVIRRQFTYWKGRGENFSLPQKLEKAHCDEFAEYVRIRLQQIHDPAIW